MDGPLPTISGSEDREEEQKREASFGSDLAALVGYGPPFSVRFSLFVEREMASGVKAFGAVCASGRSHSLCSRPNGVSLGFDFLLAFADLDLEGSICRICIFAPSFNSIWRCVVLLFLFLRA
ncbi:hypothetical protein NL676_003000 [Syzygium grande]|nr:hypothetical protein NL676_003000 [Syzygium grande]